MRRAAACALALTLVLASVVGATTFKALVSSKALVSRLKPGRRAEVTLHWTPASPPGTPARPLRATLALEPRGLALMDVATTGERVSMRHDGGEWLQPATKQLVRLAPEHAVVAMRWWNILASGMAETHDHDVVNLGPRERQIGPLHYRIVLPGTPTAPSPTDSADVWLDAAGMPSKLRLDDGLGVKLDFKLSGWRFTRARGEASFHLKAPPGYDAFDMP